ncbi:MAG: DUF262 domain-containing protein [Bacteroidales bacterium]|nr:DUF262 domain-containing protein [Bacteroidales bacterium]
MKIEFRQVTIRELYEGYENNDEGGVKAFGGLLDVRPPYQREFIYGDAEKKAVIKTVMNGFPLNVMYWAKRDDGTYEVMDGQQRSMSICEYLEGNFSVPVGEKNMPKAFENLQGDVQKEILDYKLTVYVCTGKASEKLEWFRTINIAGKPLTDQELLNASYAGPFVTDAKKKFSKSSAPAYSIGKNYLNGACLRQEYLETAIKWINGGDVMGYMSAHQKDENANELWEYFRKVIEWVNATFPKYRKEMKGVQWGYIYNRHKDDVLNAAEIETEVARLMADSDVQSKPGIYEYVLDGDEKHLGIRLFDANTKREVYERQNGVCNICKEHFEIEQMEADHIKPWREGGRTIAENCQMLCRKCNREKGGK